MSEGMKQLPAEDLAALPDGAQAARASSNAIGVAHWTVVRLQNARITRSGSIFGWPEWIPVHRGMTTEG